MFYLVRIFVNHAEALTLDDAAAKSILHRQYTLMEWRVYNIIMRPAVYISWTFGTPMLFLRPDLLYQPWVWVKLVLLVLLTVYVLVCKKHIRLLEAGSTQYSHVYYRAMNEVPTLFLVGIVFLAVFKNLINWWMWVIGVGLFAVLIFSAVKKVSRKRKADS
jgi:putative membrane protein